MGDVGCCSKFAIVVLLAALIMDVISIVTNYWESNEVWHNGLWEACTTQIKSTEVCNKSILEEVINDKFQAVRGLVLAGCGLGGLALLFSFLFMCKFTTNVFKILVLVTSALAGLVTLVGFCLYTSIDRYKYGYSFVLNVIASVTYFFVAIMIGLDKKTNTSSYQGL
ncbi:hypothetical protein LOTGIDRAFT_232623 [Lottia gigantea]|uniref:Claudin n=1 Tax=Lottia gigantea TaxID=225164 RepID=V4AEK2_LOTGI|nr:hypothetical protein LOTGIDRAFT_232623 [Lottia gigantea]ESO93570.1 hypothetical protein LOTGIDRAFT_232623 [Lottia gigantea]